MASQVLVMLDGPYVTDFDVEEGTASFTLR